MRKLFEHGQWVVHVKTGKRYQVDIDYEDLIYVVGIIEPFEAIELKAA